MSPVPPGASSVKLMRMTCLEKVRLKQLFEATLRRWGQIHEAGVNTWLVQEVKRRALSERDAAKDRLELHEQHCEVCSRRIPRSRVRVA
jgi:hypothetical protein